jgi:hypothetical protein
VNVAGTRAFVGGDFAVDDARVLVDAELAGVVVLETVGPDETGEPGEPA